MTPQNPGMLNQRALPSRSRLDDEVTWWLMAFGIVAGLDAAAFLGLPTFIETNAYHGARLIAPQWFWGALALLASTGCSTGWVADRLVPLTPDHHLATCYWIRQTATRVGLAAYGALCAVFGTSILTLTLQGFASAITGTTKWWLPLIVATRLLRRQVLS